MENSQKNSRRNESPVNNLKLSKTYDFGGLISVPEIDSSNKKKGEE